MRFASGERRTPTRGDADSRAVAQDRLPCQGMRVLVVGSGGVGSAFVAIASHREAYDHITVADIDIERAEEAVATAVNTEGGRIEAAYVDASDEDGVTALAVECGADVILNACDPRFNPPIFEGAFAADCHYVDMAMHMSEPHPTKPYEKTGRRLGDAQFAEHPAWKNRNLMALVGMGVEPGFSDVAARYAADHLFSRIDEIGVRDGADLVVDGYDFAPTFSIWTTIEECLNPPVIYERERGWFTTPPFSEPEIFTFPAGIGAAQVRQRRARRGDPDPALDRRRAGDVQVRTRRRVHQRAQDAAEARPRVDRSGRGARRAGVAPRRRRRRRSPTRPSSATRCTAAPAPARG